MARKRNDEEDDYDDEEEDERPRKRRDAESDDGLGVVVPYKNGAALAAYYCGVFGLISCFLFGVGGFFGIVPIILGVLGLMRARQNPQAHGTAHALVGIALGALEVLTGCTTVGWVAFSIMQDKRR